MSIPKILFIKNITKEKLKNNHHNEEKISEVLHNYTSISGRNISFEDIKKESTFVCWYCDIETTGICIFIPKIIEKNTKMESFLGEGYFCNFECALSHLYLYCHTLTEVTEFINKLRYLYHELYDTYPLTFYEAPSKFLRQKYGGDLTDFEYVELLKKIRNLYVTFGC